MADALNEWVQKFYIFFIVIYSYLFYSFLASKVKEQKILLIRTRPENEKWIYRREEEQKCIVC